MTEIRFERIVPKKKLSAASVPDVWRAMRAMARSAQGRLMHYPGAPAGSGYRRTGDLGRNWTVDGPKKAGNDMVVQVGNNIKYAVYVEGPSEGPKGARQTQKHQQTGWPTIDKVGKEEWEKAQPQIERALQR